MANWGEVLSAWGWRLAISSNHVTLQTTRRQLLQDCHRSPITARQKRWSLPSLSWIAENVSNLARKFIFLTGHYKISSLGRGPPGSPPRRLSADTKFNQRRHSMCGRWQWTSSCCRWLLQSMSLSWRSVTQVLTSALLWVMIFCAEEVNSHAGTVYCVGALSICCCRCNEQEPATEVFQCFVVMNFCIFICSKRLSWKYSINGAKTVFTRSAITPPKVNRFWWNPEHCEHIVRGWPWQILGAICAWEAA